MPRHSGQHPGTNIPCSTPQNFGGGADRRPHLRRHPSFACTGISLKAGDGAAIRGRALEFGFPLQSKVLVVPAGKEFSGTLPDGGKGLTFTSRYAFIGANALGLPAILDGLNDQALSVGLFYFPGYAKYTPVTDENKSRAIAPQEFGIWADDPPRGLRFGRRNFAGSLLL